MLVHTADTDKTRQVLSVLAVNTTADKTRQFCLVSTQFPIGNCSVSNILRTTENLETGSRQGQNCLVSSCVHTADADKTRQSCLVHVGGVNKLLGELTSSVSNGLIWIDGLVKLTSVEEILQQFLHLWNTC